MTTLQEKESLTKVVFRKWKDTGAIIALFPEVPSDSDGICCMSYEHVGQHGGATPSLVDGATVPATHAEYKDLARELRAIGYRLDVRSRISRNAYEIRKVSAAY